MIAIMMIIVIVVLNSLDVVYIIGLFFCLYGILLKQVFLCVAGVSYVLLIIFHNR